MLSRSHFPEVRQVVKSAGIRPTGGADRPGCRLSGDEAARAVKEGMSAREVVRGACDDRERGDGAQGREGLPAEAEGRHGVEVAEVADLACVVLGCHACEGGCTDARAVVRDFDLRRGFLV